MFKKTPLLFFLFIFQFGFSQSETASVEQINTAFKLASENDLKGILEYSEDPLVSVDVIGNGHSVVFDSDFTSVVGNLVKVIGWYDNEFGYSSRLVDLIIKIQNM